MCGAIPGLTPGLACLPATVTASLPPCTLCARQAAPAAAAVRQVLDHGAAGLDPERRQTLRVRAQGHRHAPLEACAARDHQPASVAWPGLFQDLSGQQRERVDQVSAGLHAAGWLWRPGGEGCGGPGRRQAGRGVHAPAVRRARLSADACARHTAPCLCSVCFQDYVMRTGMGGKDKNTSLDYDYGRYKASCWRSDGTRVDVSAARGRRRGVPGGEAARVAWQRCPGPAGRAFLAGSAPRIARADLDCKPSSPPLTCAPHTLHAGCADIRWRGGLPGRRQALGHCDVS